MSSPARWPCSSPKPEPTTAKPPPGQPLGPRRRRHRPEGIAAIPAEWRPGANGYDSRAVRFEQTLYLPNDPIACLAEPAPEPVEPDPEP